MKGLKAGTTAFDNAWKAEAKKNPDKFKSAQHKYIAGTHFTPAVNKIKSSTGIDASKYSVALQNVVWSIGVQHGSSGAGKLFKNAGVTAKMSEKEIIERVYNERMKVDKYFSSSSASIKKSVKNRFAQEKKQALNMLG